MSNTIGASIDTETTGLSAGKHEIVEICVILYDDNFYPKQKFLSKIKPLRPELAEPKALEVNGLSLSELKHEATPSQVRNAFIEWHEEVAENKKIVPLGHNYGFDKGFLELFFGKDHFYPLIFKDRHYKDTKRAAIFLRDSGLLKVDSVSLVNLCKHFGIKHTAHTAYSDTAATLILYKKLMEVANGNT